MQQQQEQQEQQQDLSELQVTDAPYWEEDSYNNINDTFPKNNGSCDSFNEDDNNLINGCNISKSTSGLGMDLDKDLFEDDSLLSNNTSSTTNEELIQEALNTSFSLLNGPSLSNQFNGGHSLFDYEFEN